MRHPCNCTHARPAAAPHLGCAAGPPPRAAAPPPGRRRAGAAGRAPGGLQGRSGGGGQAVRHWAAAGGRYRARCASTGGRKWQRGPAPRGPGRPCIVHVGPRRPPCAATTGQGRAAATIAIVFRLLLAAAWLSRGLLDRWAQQQSRGGAPLARWRRHPHPAAHGLPPAPSSNAACSRLVQLHPCWEARSGRGPDHIFCQRPSPPFCRHRRAGGRADGQAAPAPLAVAGPRQI